MVHGIMTRNDLVAAGSVVRLCANEAPSSHEWECLDTRAVEVYGEFELVLRFAAHCSCPLVNHPHTWLGQKVPGGRF